MDQPQNLVNCQHLPYILSLLDHPLQVLRCMRVCKGLYNTINANFHLMTKYKVNIFFITHYNHKSSEVQVYRIYCDSNPEDSTEERRTLFQISFYCGRTVLTNFTKNGTNKQVLPSNDALLSFKQFLQQELYKFDFKRITICEKKMNQTRPSTIAESILSTVFEYVQKFGIRADDCLIKSPFHIELPLLLGCKLIRLHVNDTEYAQLPLMANDGTFVKALCSLESTDAVVDPIRRIIEDMVQGQHQSFQLQLKFMFAIPSIDQILELLDEVGTIYINDSALQEYIYARISRECDEKHIVLLYRSDHSRIPYILSIWIDQ